MEAGGLTTQVADRQPLLDEDDRRRVLDEWNATEADAPQDKCVHQLIETQVALTPKAIAVVCNGERLTYAELNARANRLAHHLRTLGVQPDDRVAICAERSLEMVVGPCRDPQGGRRLCALDPAYPAERLEYMLKDSAPVAALTHGAARASLEGGMAGLACQPPVLDVEEDAAWVQKPADEP